MPCWKCIPFDLAGNNSNYQLCRQLKILKASIPPPFRVSSRPGGVRPGTPLPAQKVGTQVMPLGLSLSLLCARLPAQLGDPQQGAASGALWPLSGAAEHTGVRRGRRGQGLDGAAVGVLRPAAPKAKDPGAGGWRRRAEAAARGVQPPRLYLDAGPPLAFTWTRAAAALALCSASRRLGLLEICTSTLSGARCWGLQGALKLRLARAGSDPPRPALRPGHAHYTPTTLRARLLRPALRSNHALHAPGSSRPWRPPYSTGRPPVLDLGGWRRGLSTLVHQQDSPKWLQRKGVNVLGAPVNVPTRNNFHSLTTTLG